jgi:hypothetical protein
MPTSTWCFTVGPSKISGANLTLLGTVPRDQFGVSVLSLAFPQTGTHRIKAVSLGNDTFNSSFATLDQSIS